MRSDGLNAVDELRSNFKFMSPHDYATPTPHGFVGARHRQGLTEQIAPAIEHEARNLRHEPRFAEVTLPQSHGERLALLEAAGVVATPSAARSPY